MNRPRAARSIQPPLESLEIVVAENLLRDGAFDEASKGMTGVVHVASPLTKQTDGQVY